MATPLRKKRNFRGLQLQVSDPPTGPLPPPPLPQLNLANIQPLVIRKTPTATNPAPLPPISQSPASAVSQSSINSASSPATASASGPGKGKKRPPPMTLKAPKLPPSNINVVASTADDAANSSGNNNSSNTNGNMLTVVSSNGPNSAPNTASYASGRRNTYHAHLSNALANLDMNAEIKFELKAEDLKDLQELGQGNGGSVKKVEHMPTGTLMAKKIVLIDAKPSVRKQILRELQIMHDCRSNYIISFYGAFLADPNICICMEFMDKGSLDGIYKKIGAIDVDIVGKVALAVLEGLTYLYDVHRIIHRDIKPSNILCNSRGEIKICDFGVSGELINSIADTFVGTSTYMSPERIQGAQYTVKSDVWSLGISLIELALGRFPFAESDSDSDSDLSDLDGTLSPGHPNPFLASATNGSTPAPSGLDSLRNEREEQKEKRKKEKRKSKGVSLQGGGMTMSILELLQHIVNEPAPRLNNGPGGEGKFPRMADLFIECCLLKDPDERWTPKDLLKHEWMDYARVADVDIEEWANTF
ncbi:Pkinase-domain-containing protein [Macrolepiota fuliginosa MF-IS2]|uniref:Pkinase-domain-containing protein n=1 Tax=Macrolepiota fuliginosa MF-IS2 TaxID=1400762 RepID=A0A9P5X407_9AGAR|nr:Pkinase-domain-containing protein [Macrolepiota fuliginosa MF-IS2]